MAVWITQKTIIALLDKFQTSKRKSYLLNSIIKLFLRILNIPIILSKVIKTYLYKIMSALRTIYLPGRENLNVNCR